MTVSLAQGTGYTLGAQTSAGLDHRRRRRRARRRPPRRRASCTAARSPRSARRRRSPLATPVLTIQSTNAVVSEGTPATFVITASEAPSATDLTVNLDAGGTATSSDIVTPPSIVTLPTGTTSVQVTRPDARRQRREADEDAHARRSRAAPTTRSARPTPRTTTIIEHATCRRCTSRGGDHGVGGRLGDAHGHRRPGADPRHAGQPDVRGRRGARHRLPAGEPGADAPRRARSRRASRSDARRRRDPAEPHIVASITPSPTCTRVELAGHRGDHDPRRRPATAASPIVTLRSATTHLTKGEPYPVDDQPQQGGRPRRSRSCWPTAATRSRAPTSRCPAAASSSRRARRR